MANWNPSMVRWDDNNMPIYDPAQTAQLSPAQLLERDATNRGIAHYQDPTSGQNTWDLAYGPQSLWGAGASPKLFNWGGGAIPDSLQSLLGKYQMASPEDMKYMQTPDPTGGSDLSNIMKLFGAVVGGGMGLESMLGGAGALEGTAGDWWSGMPSGSSEWSGGLSGADGGMTGSVVEANMPTSVGGTSADAPIDYGSETPYQIDEGTGGGPYSTGTDPNMGLPPGSPGAPGGPTGIQDMGDTIQRLTEAAGLPANDPSLMDKLTAYLKTPAGLAAAASLGISAAGVVGSIAASRAQAGAARDSNSLLKYMYDTTRADFEPWRTAGQGAVKQLTQLTTPGQQLDQAMLDPGYQFRQQQGEQGINRALAARGGWDSGAALKGLTRFNQDYATGEFGNVYNRLSNLAGLGQTATANTAQAGSNYGQQGSQAIQGAGNARASGYMGVANALGGGIGQYLNYSNQQTLLDKLLGGGG